MRRDSFHDHIAAKNKIIQADGNMTGTMPRQMDQLEGADPHINLFICEINRNRMIDGFRKAVNAEELVTRLCNKTSLSQERSEAPTDQCQFCFVVRDCLQVEFVDSDLCLRDGFQLRESAVVINMSVS